MFRYFFIPFTFNLSNSILSVIPFHRTTIGLLPYECRYFSIKALVSFGTPSSLINLTEASQCHVMKVNNSGILRFIVNTHGTLNFPVPINAKDVQSFLGLSRYYRRFVPKYEKIAKPLTPLLKENAEFKWSDLCQKAFEDLKTLFLQNLIFIIQILADHSI